MGQKRFKFGRDLFICNDKSSFTHQNSLQTKIMSDDLNGEDDEFFDVDDVIDSYDPIQSSNIQNELTKEWIGLTRRNFGRTKLPVQMFDRSQISIWSILKQCIGKELSKISMPIIWNEPVSFLQRFTENVLYSYLLDKAEQCDDPIMRMQYVAAFAVSSIASNIDRLSKPFNPLLGETYEFSREELSFRFMSEQVCHHPPVSAFTCESLENRWKFYGSILPKVKFTVKKMIVEPKGTLTLELKRHNEIYTWESLTCTIHNIVVGKLWFEYHGTMEVVNHTRKLRAVLNFKPYSWSTRELHKVEGYVYDSNKQKVRGLYGFWTDSFFSIDIDNFEAFLKQMKKEPKQSTKSSATASLVADESEDLDNEDVPDNTNEHNLPPNSYQLWKIIPKLDYSPQYYNFNLFTMALNELTDDVKRQCPPTDCRFRPDMRKMEDGDIDTANQEKNRLEEKQRAARLEREKRKDDWTPMWFRTEKHSITGEDVWCSNNRYWQRQWSDCPDIF
ncbi:unnamed protein product [Didymodactylos carnosus]|uniref:Oxysterol-binding protein n=1 Tax=Didymodactylos carnosus TaxID=1234261 RepID=A0A814QZE0_9BILA|nr:unnamed protein product [Didymodactylos carnosus]CAF3890201.1 unnamed protein product [Didymodactylos carnosus]